MRPSTRSVPRRNGRSGCARVTLAFPSGRTAEEIVVDDAAGLAWIVNLGCIELHPHPVCGQNLDHPDELRVDLDPGPGTSWSDVCAVALEVKSFLEEMGLRGWPKTSGSRGMHINVRIEPRWTFTDVRRAALALSRTIEERVPAIATSKWWKEERHGVFLDYNQNAKDRTTCSAYSVRPLPDARVSTPLHWDEVEGSDPAAFTVFTVPQRFAEIGRSACRHESNLEARSNDCSRLQTNTTKQVWVTRRGRRTSARRLPRESEPPHPVLRSRSRRAQRCR